MFRAELAAERERQALAERINSGLFAAEDRRFGRLKSVQSKAAAIAGRQQVPAAPPPLFCEPRLGLLPCRVAPRNLPPGFGQWR